MDLIWDGLREAVRLIATGDGDLFAIAVRSLFVSGISTLLSLAVGFSIGALLALTRFPGRSAMVALVNAGMGLPPVVVGLAVTVMLWRSGPLGDLRMLYSVRAMILAQLVIATPVVAALTLSALQSLSPNLRLQVLSLGASRYQTLFMLLVEARLAILAAVMAGFGAVISEVGASIMVGGNIHGQTQVLTTAIVQENGRGHFDVAIALSIILLAIIFAVNLVLSLAQQRRLR